MAEPGDVGEVFEVSSVESGETFDSFDANAPVITGETAIKTSPISVKSFDDEQVDAQSEVTVDETNAEVNKTDGSTVVGGKTVDTAISPISINSFDEDSLEATTTNGNKTAIAANENNLALDELTEEEIQEVQEVEKPAEATTQNGNGEPPSTDSAVVTVSAATDIVKQPLSNKNDLLLSTICYYHNNPEQHRSYNKEWSKYYHDKKREDANLDITSAALREAWIEHWKKRVINIVIEDCEKELAKHRRRSSKKSKKSKKRSRSKDDSSRRTRKRSRSKDDSTRRSGKKKSRKKSPRSPSRSRSRSVKRADSRKKSRSPRRRVSSRSPRDRAPSRNNRSNSRDRPGTSYRTDRKSRSRSRDHWWRGAPARRRSSSTERSKSGSWSPKSPSSKPNSWWSQAKERSTRDRRRVPSKSRSKSPVRPSGSSYQRKKSPPFNKSREREPPASLTDRNSRSMSWEPLPPARGANTPKPQSNDRPLRNQRQPPQSNGPDKFGFYQAPAARKSPPMNDRRKRGRSRSKSKSWSPMPTSAKRTPPPSINQNGAKRPCQPPAVPPAQSQSRYPSVVTRPSPSSSQSNRPLNTMSSLRLSPDYDPIQQNRNDFANRNADAASNRTLYVAQSPSLSSVSDEFYFQPSTSAAAVSKNVTNHNTRDTKKEPNWPSDRTNFGASTSSDNRFRQTNPRPGPSGAQSPPPQAWIDLTDDNNADTEDDKRLRGSSAMKSLKENYGQGNSDRELTKKEIADKITNTLKERGVSPSDLSPDELKQIVAEMLKQFKSEKNRK